jgi:hypothetical protein
VIEDRDKNVVYVPISRDLLPSLKQWSEPVRFRIEDLEGEWSLVFERLELQPVDLSKGRAA